jgi:hypothetical protein
MCTYRVTRMMVHFFHVNMLIFKKRKHHFVSPCIFNFHWYIGSRYGCLSGAKIYSMLPYGGSVAIREMSHQLFRISSDYENNEHKHCLFLLRITVESVPQYIHKLASELCVCCFDFMCYASATAAAHASLLPL